MSNKIVTVVKKANESKGKVLTVKNELETWQGIVDGYIETFPLTDDIIVILNEEGKLRGLKPNFAIHCFGGGFEMIVGDVAFISYDNEGNFASLTDDHIQYLKCIGLLSE